MQTRARKHGSAFASRGGRHAKSGGSVRSQAVRRHVRRVAEGRHGGCRSSRKVVAARRQQPGGNGPAAANAARTEGGSRHGITVAEHLPVAPLTVGQAACCPSIAASRPADRREIERLLRSLVRNAGGVCQLATLAADCRADLPLSRSLVLSIEERIASGDVRAIRDAVAELVADLEVWIGDYDTAVGDDHESRARIDEVLAAKQRRGELKFDPDIAGDGGEGSQPDGAAEDLPQRKDGTRRSRRACGRK